jgi:rhodanese-related sulfurtransferase
MPILVLLLVISIFWIIRIVWPVNGLAFVDSEALKNASEVTATMKILDVRDAVDYQNCHVPSSINISIGRLPFLWKKELSPNEPILIVSDSPYKSKKAARLLKKQGFDRLYALREMHCA